MRVLATKLHRPSIPSKRILRSRLIARLNDGLVAGRQISLISAPAGFDKSTCAADWLSTLSMPMTWLSLDSADNDPERFFAYLVAALQQVDGKLGEDINTAVQLGQMPSAEVISTALIKARLPPPRKIVL